MTMFNGGSKDNLIGRGGSAAIRDTSVKLAGGAMMRSTPNAGAGPATRIASTSHAQASMRGANPSPKPMPTTNGAGRNSSAADGEGRGMRAPNQSLAKGARP